MNKWFQPKGTILIVDDEEGIRVALHNLFTNEGYEAHTAATKEAALDKLNSVEPDIALVDIRLKGANGVELLKKIKKIHPETSVIMITGYGSIESSVSAMKEGASDYILKPVDNTTIVKAVRKNLEIKSLRSENTFLKSEIRQSQEIRSIRSENREVQQIISIADRVKDTSASILITGESGTGKELLARYIHFTGNRRNANFVGVNSAALSESLLLSELFGHEKGSFTGAIEQRRGKFEMAHGGTLFLDEIGDMSPDIQAKILRVLEERSFERVGGGRAINVDVRVIAATNRDLEKLIAEGHFRKDLYYRLNVITCRLPPLRERKEDIPLLIEQFIKCYNDRYNKRITRMQPQLVERLMEHDWPGNIRELQNMVNQAVLLCEGNVITALQLSEESQKTIQHNRPPHAVLENGDCPRLIKEAADRYLGEFETKFIREALRKNNGNKTRTADELGISRKTLARKIMKYHI